MKKQLKKSIFLLVALVNTLTLGMLGLATPPADYTPPDVSIVMMTDFSKETWENTLDLSRNGEYVVASNFDYTVLYKIPNSFDGESEMIWNITSDNSGMRSAHINEDGTIITLIDADPDIAYGYSKSGTDDIWAYDYGNYGVYKDTMDKQGNVFYFVYFNAPYFYHIGLNASTGNVLWENVNNDYTFEARMNYDGSRLALGLSNGTIRYLNGYTGEVLWSGQAGLVDIQGLAVSEDGSTVVSNARIFANDDNITVWDGDTGDVLWTSVMEVANDGISISATGDQIIFGSYTMEASDKKIRSYQRSSKTINWEIDTTVQTRMTAFSAQNQIGIAGIYDGMVLIFDGGENGYPIMEHNTYSNQITDVAISADGRTAVALTFDGMIIAYKTDVETNQQSAGLFNDVLQKVQNLAGADFVLLGGATLVGLIIGGLFFGLMGRKK